ncbi:MAG: transglutaminase family protein [Arcobacter sp.]|nr:transglutaminase family protein [Arcobacter sp.]
MIYEIYHETSFEYPNLVTFSHNIARLKPTNSNRQKLLEYKLDISPKLYETNEFIDFFENTNNFILLRIPHKSLTLKAFSKVELDTYEIQKNINNYFTSQTTLFELKERFKRSIQEDICPKLYLFPTSLIPYASSEIVLYALESFYSNRSLFSSVYEFMGRIFEDFKFVSGFSDVTTPIEIIFAEKKGVCQDFAQFAISALRTIGIPARYMSGYIRTIPMDGKEKLFGTDASHAWFSVYIPDMGWVDFDPTNNKIPNEDYIVLGYGRDYHDIAPLKGVVQSSGLSKLTVKVDVKCLR